MNWLEVAENNKKNYKEPINRMDELEKQNRILENILKDKFLIANKLVDRINEAFSYTKESNKKSKIIGNIIWSGATYESVESRIVEKISEYDYERNLYKKRKLTVSLNPRDHSNSSCIWRFIEIYFGSSSHRNTDWEYSSWSTYDKKPEEKIISETTLPIKKLESTNENVWLDIFEWLIFLKDRLR